MMTWTTPRARRMAIRDINTRIGWGWAKRRLWWVPLVAWGLGVIAGYAWGAS